MTDSDAKEWVTVKLPKEVRDEARDDPRTYGEIMRDGLGNGRVTTTGEDPLAMYEDFRDVIQEAVEGANTSTDDLREQLDRIERGVATTEERTGNIQRSVEELSR